MGMKKQWKKLKKRVAALEVQIQKQQSYTTESTARCLEKILLEQISSHKADIPSES